MKNHKRIQGGAELGVVLIIAIIVAHVILIPIFLAIEDAHKITVLPGEAVTLPAVATSLRPPLISTVPPTAGTPVFQVAAASPATRTLTIESTPEGLVSMFVPAFTVVEVTLDMNRWFIYRVVCEDTTILLDPKAGPEHLYFRGKAFGL